MRAFSPLRDFSAPPSAQETAPALVSVEEAERRARAAADAARDAALEEGRALGLAEAKREGMAAIAAAAEKIASLLEEERGAQEARLDDVELRATRLVLAVVAKLAARLSEEESRKVCERIAPQAIAAAAASSRFVIAVPEAIAASLRETLAPALMRRSLSPDDFIRADPSLGEGAIKAEWSGGGVSFDPAERQKDVDALIDRALARLGAGTSQDENDKGEEAHG